MDIKPSYEPTARQRYAHENKTLFTLFGGSMGGGKSYWLCQEAIDLAMRFKGNRILMARYTLKDFRDTTLVTLLRDIPSGSIESHNLANHEIKLVNGSLIKYTGLSDEDGVSTLKSFECGAILWDEANEIAYDNFLLARTRLRWILPDGTRPIYYFLLTSNPEDCWLKDMFVNGKGGEEFTFIQSLPKDNDKLPPDYFKHFKDMPEEWRNRYWEGSWDDISEGNFIIPADLVNAAIDRDIAHYDEHCMGIDVAKGVGGDESVIYVGDHCRVIDSFAANVEKIDALERQAMRFYSEYDVECSAVDDVGIGAGVTNFLQEIAKCDGVEGIEVGRRTDDERFFNTKMELWWYARQQFIDGKVSIPNDSKLIRQLSSVKYKCRRNGKMIVEDKEETKRRIGCSPDRADALILMIWSSRNLTGNKYTQYERNFEQYCNEQTQGHRYSYGWDEVLIR